MYQRVNWMLHPADDLMQIVRFKFFNGNSTKAMFAVLFASNHYCCNYIFNQSSNCRNQHRNNFWIIIPRTNDWNL